jgi:hypothetical protein
MRRRGNSEGAAWDAGALGWKSKQSEKSCAGAGRGTEDIGNVGAQPSAQ